MNLRISYILVALTFVACNHSTQTAQSTESIKPDSTPMVYICNSPWAECYHIYENCEGLENCSGYVKKISLAEAEKKGRRPCGFCTK